MAPSLAYGILIVGFVAWAAPFFVIRRNVEAPVAVDPRARWGLLLQAVAYPVATYRASALATPAWWRVALSVVFLILAAVFAWLARRSLGRQWRLDAGLNADHQLVQSGVYRLVRHPIYTSMVSLLLGMGFMLTPLPRLFLSLVLLMIGTEVRVRSEERLLTSRFGEQYRRFRSEVPAYVPFARRRDAGDTAPGSPEKEKAPGA